MKFARFLTIFRKEILDNLRDRRTLTTAILFGPLFGPIMLVVMVNFAVSLALEDVEKPLELPVAGAEHAPSLMRFLEQHNTTILPPPDDPRRAVRDRVHDMVLIVPAGYPDDFRAGVPAVLELVIDSSDRHAAKHYQRAERLLEAYGRQIAVLRLQARGVNAEIMSPLVVRRADTATPQARSAVLLGMLPYFIVFAALMGGFYLAIDTTAGERERGSLEPLLATAASRGELMLGKLAATGSFAVLSLLVAVAMLALTVPFVPLARLGMASSLDVATVGAMCLTAVPFALLAAALLSVVASFTKSFKEAQTWLSFVLFVPLLPSFAAMLYPMQPSLALMLVPVLSQNLLLMEYLKGAPVDAMYIAASGGTTLLLTAVFAAIAVKLYQREAILG